MGGGVEGGRGGGGRVTSNTSYSQSISAVLGYPGSWIPGSNEYPVFTRVPVKGTIFLVLGYLGTPGEGVLGFPNTRFKRVPGTRVPVTGMSFRCTVTRVLGEGGGGWWGRATM